jgi:hypothetical protein
MSQPFFIRRGNGEIFHTANSQSLRFNYETASFLLAGQTHLNLFFKYDLPVSDRFR